MERSTICGYEFTSYLGPLERLAHPHPHRVRREPGVTYEDKFALQQLSDINPELYDQVLKGWSRSYYLPDKHLESILAYASKDIPISSLKQNVYRDAIQEARIRLCSLPSVRAINVLNELDQVTFTSSSAAGYDYLGEKGPKGGSNHHRAIQRAKAILWSVHKNEDGGIEHAIKTMVPDVGYTRTQLADLYDKTKVRNVWGRAFHYILLEGVVACPLLEAFKTADTFYHIGQDPQLSVPDLLSRLSRDCKWKYALDWKQFDASVSKFEIQAAFDLIKEKVSFPNAETETAFEISRQLFIHKKIAAPDGLVYWAHKGIPSGSYFTSIIGSIVNFLRIQYLWRDLSGHGPKIIFTQGDDSLCGDDELIQPYKMAEVSNQIGWTFNPSKTEYSTASELISFLGRTYEGGLNRRDLVRCLRLLIFPEYPVESGRISAFRAKSIADDAGGVSEILNRISTKLKRRYGVASDEEVPTYFKRYVHGM